MELLKHLKLAESQYNSRSFTHIETFLRHKIISSTGTFRRTEGMKILDITYGHVVTANSMVYKFGIAVQWPKTCQPALSVQHQFAGRALIATICIKVIDKI